MDAQSVLYLLRCSGCGVTDMSMWPKHRGVKHHGAEGVCGRWVLLTEVSEPLVTKEPEVERKGPFTVRDEEDGAWPGRQSVSSATPPLRTPEDAPFLVLSYRPDNDYQSEEEREPEAKDVS
jgi:hypothetical protein